MSGPGRKKSLVGGLSQIDIPQPTQSSTLLNKAASQSTSLYKQCTQLRARLMRIHDFPPFFSILASTHSRQSTDPVHQLWDTLALGTPLCFLFNLLPEPAGKIEGVDTHPSAIGVDQRKDQQKAAAKFIMGVQRLKNLKEWDESIELFTVTELMDQNKNTNGFVKVVGTVTHLLDRLPAECFEEEKMPSSPPLTTGFQTGGFDSKDSLESPFPASDNEKKRNFIIRELLETERKFVQDLEVMQTYARSLINEDVVDQDTIHHLFPGLNKLLDFQRRFLIGLEGTAEQPWQEQHWGQHFTVNEEAFQVYEPYCANYINAAEIMLTEEPNLMRLSHVIHPKNELPAFLIKPVQRICKYPLLLEDLGKHSNPKDYPLHDELLDGIAAAKRIADKVNEAQRYMENQATAKTLEKRVEDWKGHHMSNFGDLLLDDVFMVTKSDVDREYHVFLFEKIILCCKDNPPLPPPTPGGRDKKVSKSNSILKKQGPPGSQPSLLSLGPNAKKRTTPLLLKGRIFLNNVIKAVPKGQSAGQYSLQVWWRGDDDLEYFTLRCRSDEQLRQWETTITRMIKDNNRYPDMPSNSTNPAGHSRAPSATSTTSTLPPYPGPGGYARTSARFHNNSEERIPPVPSGPYSRGNSFTARSYEGYQQSNSSRDGGFDTADNSEDEGARQDPYRDPPSGRNTPSGRGTPSGGRRAMGVSQSMPPERDLAPGYERTRAQTEGHSGNVMTTWRSQAHTSHGPPAPPPPGGLPPPPAFAQSGYGQRPPLNRGGASDGNGSFGPGQPRLGSKFSSTKLKAAYDEGGYQRDSQHQGRSPPAMTGSVSRATGGSYIAHSSSREQLAPPISRNRSLSNPASYGQGNGPRDRQAPPPLPISGQAGQYGNGRAVGGPNGGKRESGSSESTGESSEMSPSQTMSPITPYGDSVGHHNLRATRSQGFGPGGGAGGPPPNAVRLKVHYGVDIFMLQVSRDTEFWDLMDKIERKLKQCGKKPAEGPAKIKYRDEDGDMVSLTTDDELQMAFEMNGQLALHVQR